MNEWMNEWILRLPQNKVYDSTYILSGRFRQLRPSQYSRCPHFSRLSIYRRHSNPLHHHSFIYAHCFLTMQAQSLTPGSKRTYSFPPQTVDNQRSAFADSGAVFTRFHLPRVLAHDAFVRTNRWAIAMMFVRLAVDPSVRRSVLSETGVHCDHTVHVNADSSLWLDSQCSEHIVTKACAPTPSRFLRFHLEERWVWMCKLDVISQERLKIEVKC